MNTAQANQANQPSQVSQANTASEEYQAAAAALAAPARYLKGVGPRLADALAARGIGSVGDVLRCLPRRYEHRLGWVPVAQLQVGTAATIDAEVVGVQSRPLRGRQTLHVRVADRTGVLTLTWFHVPWRGFAQRFARGVRVLATGTVSEFRGRLQMVHPEVRVPGDLDDELDDAASPASPVARSAVEPGPKQKPELVPVYSEIDGFRPAHWRRIVAAALPLVAAARENLPAALREARCLVPLAEALRSLHAPPAGADFEALNAMATPWHRRLIYEELLLLQLAVLQRKVQHATLLPGRALALREPLRELAREVLSFELTDGQRRALDEIEADLRRDTPMSRLLQGDVGSGKTAVALVAAAAVARAGLQAAIMAPTELLAEQHWRTASQVLGRAGVSVALVTGSLGAAERRQRLEALRAGSLAVIVGTHALIQEDIAFRALGLAIVDEQHRFGVLQRARLVELGAPGLGAAPHALVMTATPIPRTLALTLYGDLDLTLIEGLPPGRTPVRTAVYRDRERPQIYRRVRAAVEAGRQAYVVFPLVEGSDKEGMQRLLDATTSAEELAGAGGVLAGLRVGLLHGRLRSEEKEAVMQQFAAGALDVLVATTVIEVGIDVPNATVMVVEHAERFGLSQLHQLRGRVGRGAHRSECMLVAHDAPSDDAWRRLTVMERTNDGFRIAEEDLAIRGPGDFVGTRQSGLPALTIANLARDQELLLAARDDAAALLARDPELRLPEHAGLRAAFGEGGWQERVELAGVG